ncbi:MAG: serine/threonine protein kinase [Deltaproteobacteria bacterium]|nr:serine/threonine protein kinase [Deltaproteobacteria bacterium]
MAPRRAHLAGPEPDKTLTDPEPLGPAGGERGQVLGGRYRLGALLGAGAMGSVYEGWNTRTGRKVAVKVLHPSRAARAVDLERFEREARAAAEVAHPNIVEVLDFDREATPPFLVLEHLEGETLEARLERQGALDPGEALQLLLPVLSALEAAHARRVVHRDLKPANVFLARTRDGGVCPKVLDFGVAWVPGARRLTGQHVLLGTPAYMAPEQARSVPDLDARADLWSFGAMLYECVSGRLPYDGASVAEVLVRSATESPVDLRALCPELPEALTAVVHRALDRNRALRYGSARALREALLRAAGSPEELSPVTRSVAPAARPSPLRRYTLAAAGALGLLLGVPSSRSALDNTRSPVPPAFPTPAPRADEPALRAFSVRPLRVRVRTRVLRRSAPSITTPTCGYRGPGASGGRAVHPTSVPGA